MRLRKELVDQRRVRSAMEQMLPAVVTSALIGTGVLLIWVCFDIWRRLRHRDDAEYRIQALAGTSSPLDTAKESPAEPG